MNPSFQDKAVAASAQVHECFQAQQPFPAGTFPAAPSLQTGTTAMPSEQPPEQDGSATNSLPHVEGHAEQSQISFVPGNALDAAYGEYEDARRDLSASMSQSDTGLQMFPERTAQLSASLQRTHQDEFADQQDASEHADNSSGHMRAVTESDSFPHPAVGPSRLH